MTTTSQGLRPSNESLGLLLIARSISGRMRRQFLCPPVTALKLRAIRRTFNYGVVRSSALGTFNATIYLSNSSLSVHGFSRLLQAKILLDSFQATEVCENSRLETAPFVALKCMSYICLARLRKPLSANIGCSLDLVLDPAADIRASHSCARQRATELLHAVWRLYKIERASIQ